MAHSLLQRRQAGSITVRVHEGLVLPPTLDVLALLDIESGGAVSHRRVEVKGLGGEHDDRDSDEGGEPVGLREGGRKG